MSIGVCVGKSVESAKSLQAAKMFHVKLGALMDQRGIETGELAQLLGLDRSVVQRWRRGQTRPSAVNFGWLLQILGVGPEELVGRPDLEDQAVALEQLAAKLSARAHLLRGAPGPSDDQVHVADAGPAASFPSAPAETATPRGKRRGA